MKLIDNWRMAWRWASVRVAALAVAWGVAPPDVQASILDLVGVPASRVPAIIGLLVIAGRLVAQPQKADGGA